MSAVTEASGRRLVLVGASGSGRSTVGALVAGSLGGAVRELEDVLAAERGVAWEDLVLGLDANLGADLERLAVRELGEGEWTVLTLPPSALESDAVLDALDGARAAGVRVVLLDVDVAEVARREGLNGPRSVGLGAPRALLAVMIRTFRERVGGHVDEIVDTVGLEAGAVAGRIADSL